MNTHHSGSQDSGSSVISTRRRVVGIRWAFAIPVSVLNLFACATCQRAVSFSPYQEYEGIFFPGIEGMCCATIGLSALAICLSCVSLARRVLSPWFMAAPVTLILIAVTRWASMLQSYLGPAGT